jgi:hypothetical protein
MTNRDFWNDFNAGAARAKHELPRLADDLMLLPRIVADPAAHGLDRPGLLAGYFARVAEGLRRDPAARRGRRK